MQRVSDSWCSTIGSTAIAIVLTFCNANADLKDSDENRQEFAAQYLEHLRFLYHKANGDDAKVSKLVQSFCLMLLTRFTEIQRSLPWPLHPANIRCSSHGH
jgi:hypothetical protein